MRPAVLLPRSICSSNSLRYNACSLCLVHDVFVLRFSIIARGARVPLLFVDQLYLYDMQARFASLNSVAFDRIEYFLSFPHSLS